jgi:DNA-binding LacI/PurR family transcriptional regulator
MSITQRQLAAHLGLSQGTVSYAFRPDSRITPETRSRVLAAAAKLGYRPNAAARAMVRRRSGQIGVLLPSLGHAPGAGDYAYDTLGGCNSVLEPSGYTTCVVQMADVERGPEGLTRVFQEQALDGMIVHAGLAAAARNRIDDLIERIVWCDSGVRSRSNCLWRDEQAAGRLVGEALLRAGYRRARFVFSQGDPQRPYRHRQLRERGLRQVMERAGGSVESFNAPALTASVLAGSLAQPDPDQAIVASDHVQAEQILTLAMQAGWFPGHHAAVASCDDRAWYARHWPQLSRASFDRFAMGAAAAHLMLDQLAQPTASGARRRIVPDWIPGDAGGLRPTLVPRDQLVARP